MKSSPFPPFWLILAITLLLLESADCVGGKPKNKKKGSHQSKPSNAKKDQNLEAPESFSTADQQPHLDEAKGKSPVVGPSSTVLALYAKERQKKTANDLRTMLEHFDIGKYLAHDIPHPETKEEYKNLVWNALENLQNDRQKTVAQIIGTIERGLNGRRLRYIRLIGAGSLRRHDEHFNWHSEARADYLAVMGELGPELQEKYNQFTQLAAIYQLALAKMIADYPPFKNAIEGVTVEDVHLDESEKEFLTDQFGYTAIVGRNGPEGNLAKIPAKVAEMGEGDATLVIMINCGLEITLPLFDSYGKEGPKQLILMESSLESATKATTKPEKEGLQKYQRIFGAGHPLPNTNCAKLVFQQQGGTQIYFIENWTKKGKMKKEN